MWCWSKDLILRTIGQGVLTHICLSFTTFSRLWFDTKQEQPWIAWNAAKKLREQDINISFRADLQGIMPWAGNLKFEVLSSSSLFPKFFLTDRNKKLMSLYITVLLICFKLSNILVLETLLLFTNVWLWVSSGDILYFSCRMMTWVSLVAQMVKNLSAMWETQIQSLGYEHPLKQEMVTHSSILACKIPWEEEPGRLPSWGSQSQTWLSN